MPKQPKIWDEERLVALLDNPRKATWMTWRLGYVLEDLAKWASEAIELATHDDRLLRYDRRELMRVLRIAITGSTKGPSLFEVMALVGRESCINRITHLNFVADIYGLGNETGGGEHYTETLTTPEKVALRA